jgi:hypothetical protein
MARSRKQVLLWILAATSAVAVYIRWPGSPGATAVPAARPPARAARGNVSVPVPDVRLDALGEERPTPEGAHRNLFKFKPKPPPPPPPRPAFVAVPAPVIPTGPPPPPPLPPIALKFIGLLEARPNERIAILSDGRGAPVYGKEGDTVLGQYRIVRIGTESIEMTYLDGRGRQTIRLSGS